MHNAAQSSMPAMRKTFNDITGRASSTANLQKMTMLWTNDPFTAPHHVLYCIGTCSLPAKREPLAGMGGGAGGGAAERGAPRDGLMALRGVFSFCATAAAAASAPSHSVCPIVFTSASPRGIRWVCAFLLICR